MSIKVWQYFISNFHMSWPKFFNPHSWLGIWFDHGVVDSMINMVYSLVPILVLWEIWKERYNRRYSYNSLTQPHGVINKIKHSIVSAMGLLLRKNTFF